MGKLLLLLLLAGSLGGCAIGTEGCNAPGQPPNQCIHELSLEGGGG